MKRLILTMLGCIFLINSIHVTAVPQVTGEPVIMHHPGQITWPQDTPIEIPFLTQTNSSDINDLHGDLDCDFIISTAGNYHFALLQAMQGRDDLNFSGLQSQLLQDYGLRACWSTSPPISVDQTLTEKLQFKNIIIHGKPALAIGPGNVMNALLAKNFITSSTAFVNNKGNAILLRHDKSKQIKNICDLGKRKIRVVTPNKNLEQGSFGNFSGTLFNVADQNEYGCDATTLFNGIFSQDLSTIDLSAFENPTNIDGVMGVYGRGRHPQGKGAKWIASSRIMHRDIPYALCYDLADAGIIFYHQAVYLKKTMAETMNCKLNLLALPGTRDDAKGNRFGTLRIAKILGHTDSNILQAQDAMFDFFVNSPIWTQILNEHYLEDPSPN